MKTMTFVMKNNNRQIKNRLDITEEKIDDLETIARKTIQKETQKEKIEFKIL